MYAFNNHLICSVSILIWLYLFFLILKISLRIDIFPPRNITLFHERIFQKFSSAPFHPLTSLRQSINYGHASIILIPPWSSSLFLQPAPHSLGQLHQSTDWNLCWFPFHLLSTLQLPKSIFKTPSVHSCPWLKLFRCHWSIQETSVIFKVISFKSIL